MDKVLFTDLFFFKCIVRRIINGNPISDVRLVDKNNFIYEIKESKIIEIFIVVEYKLLDGAKIKIEQKDFAGIRKGDRVIDSSPNFPLPNGSYRIQGKGSGVRFE